jgi:hypothetical protein
MTTRYNIQQQETTYNNKIQHTTTRNNIQQQDTTYNNKITSPTTFELTPQDNLPNDLLSVNLF